MVDKSEGGDPNLLVPDPALVPIIDEALDQLDAGISFREVADRHNSKASRSLSHAGLKIIWDQQRPDHPRRIANPYQPSKQRMTHPERSKYRKKIKLQNEKKTLAAVKRRIVKAEEELGIRRAKEAEELKNLKAPVIEVPHDGVEYDFSSIPKERTVVFRPNEGPQTDFFASDEQEVLYGGAAGGGKSYALIADPLRYFGHPQFNGLILRRTNDELRELIWKSQELYPKAWPGATWSEKKSSWTFKNGGHLWMTYLERDEDVMRYQGQAFSYVGFDELTQYPTPFAWNYLRTRLRTTAADLPLYQRGTTNPGGPGHGWVKRMFVDPAPSGTAFPATDLETDTVMVYPDGHAKAGQPLFYRKFIQAKLKDNPYYADGAYETNLLSQGENVRRQLLEGDWTVSDGAAFSEFRQNLHVCQPFDIPHSWMKFRSCDFGYSARQASAVHWYAIDPIFGTIYVYRELYVNLHTGTMLGEKIKQIEEQTRENISYGVLDSSVWHVRGNSGPTIAEEILSTGIRFRPSDRGPGSRISSKNRLHELLRINPETGKPGIIFFDTCRHIIGDLPMIPMSKTDDDIDRTYANDHAYDSIRYGIQTRPKASSGWDWEGSKSQTNYRPVDQTFGY